MSTRIFFSTWIVVAAATFAVGTHADTPPVYAIKGARIVTAAGAPIATGTLVIRNGVIDAVGADVQAPADAVVIEGSGLAVYPGLIDMGNSAGLDASGPAAPANFRTTEEAERFRRSAILRAELEAADALRPDAPELARLAAAGITSVLATPAGGVIKGRSALVNVAAPADEPQIGALADPRKGLQVLRTPVALHVDFGGRGAGGGFPGSLMGSIAFVRQSFLDAQHHELARQHYERVKTAPRPIYDPALQAMQLALAGRLPVAFEADAAREILRALAMAKQFKLDPVITSAREADQVIADLKAQNARVIYSLNFPTRSRMLPPDADEPARELRARAQAPKVPAALEKGGITFAFSSSGVREPRDFLRNAARAVRNDGLSPEEAVRALTINAATIAGAADRLGSLEKGKIANVVVTEGGLFDEKMRIRHVFVDGRMVSIEETPQQGGRGRSGQ